ncbi:DNA/RNA non-specific endonuclease [Streptomyces sp. NPDC057616]|uniref:DNA/RNA non-specific endonuclease n=1 Tax=Streptomyces sp. NPDC057616 TaxID=3346183 RepID=UPI00369E4DC6
MERGTPEFGSKRSREQAQRGKYVRQVKMSVKVLLAGCTGGALLIGGTAANATAQVDEATKAPQATAVKLQARDAIPCHKYLKKAHKYRSILTYDTDDEGRPSGAVARNLKLKDRPRNDCQTKVGSWGGAGHDGAHLIAASLNGTTQRANLVPTTEIVNRTIMKAFENQAKKCLKTNSPHHLQVNNYGVTVYYPRDRGVIPNKITMVMDVARAGTDNNGHFIEMDFKNIKYTRGGAHRITNKLAKDVKAAGCTGR